MKEIKLTLQENEVRAVFQLIDVAVKSQGLQVSEVARRMMRTGMEGLGIVPIEHM